MPEKSASSSEPRRVAAAERALSLLDAFIGKSGPLSLGELEEASGLFRSVIFRYMISFEQCGYVRKVEDGKYRLTGKVLQLAAAFEADFNLEDVVRPALRDLSRKTSESAVFYVPMDGQRLCISRVDSPQALRYIVTVGTLLPIDSSATGLVFQEYAEMTARSDISSDLPLGTSGIGDTSSASISAPVFSAGEKFIGAITLSGPATRFDPGHGPSREMLVATARDISRTLGSVAAYP